MYGLPRHRGVVRHDDNHHRHRQQAERTSAVLPPSTTREYMFCIELGLVLRSRHSSHGGLHALEREISVQLAKAGIANHVTSSDERRKKSGSDNFQEWTIVSDRTIQSQPKDHRYGLKLVSPFMHFSRFDGWIAQIRTVMDVLNREFEVTTTHQCGTHVHIVPVCGIWGLSHVKALAKSIVYFERCFDGLIEAQPTFQELAGLLNWCGRSSPTGLALGQSADFQHDAFRWNFTNLNEGGGLGTIEFRQPPGATSSSDPVMWVLLVGCFAQLSCSYADSLKPHRPAELSSLGEWVLYQAELANAKHKSLLRALFAQATMPHTPAKPVNMKADDEQRLRDRVTERKIVSEKYRKYMSSQRAVVA
ncbi:hypothetical protein B0T17DRAFT_506748 [Bombardia bombarda]|uniref:Amidoligase enzyme-domain-containing protein n=1 Tax=Bombardia bombarda TaxID=252184 RepID=A0AA40C9L4_9PEZI|nr:hypothetical protein B0T17DRAFT_506748 [Bombardia bombarda]